MDIISSKRHELEPESCRRGQSGAKFDYKAALSLLALTLQNTALVLLMKLSYRDGAERYSTAAAVFSAELLKLFVCGAQMFVSGGPEHVITTTRTTKSEVKLMLPCVLYVVQNNLLYIAISYLDAAAYVACSQAKILSSAFFSHLLLGTVLKKQQICALVILALGISCMQISERGGKYTKQPNNWLVGLLAVFGASITSGFAGVYLERIYKDKTKTVWERNFHLSIFSLPISLLSVLHASDKANTFFFGFDTIVWLVISLQATGGIITSLVMRYASTLLKCFAVSISISLCMVISAQAQHETLALNQVAGAMLVNISVFMYSVRQV